MMELGNQSPTALGSTAHRSLSLAACHLLLEVRGSIVGTRTSIEANKEAPKSAAFLIMETVQKPRHVITANPSESFEYLSLSLKNDVQVGSPDVLNGLLSEQSGMKRGGMLQPPLPPHRPSQVLAKPCFSLAPEMFPSVALKFVLPWLICELATGPEPNNY